MPLAGEKNVQQSVLKTEKGTDEGTVGNYVRGQEKHFASVLYILQMITASILATNPGTADACI